MKTQVRIGKDKVYTIKKACEDLQLKWEILKPNDLGDVILMIEHTYPHELFYLGRSSRIQEQIWDLTKKTV